MSPAGSVTNGAIFLPIQIGATGATGTASSVGSTQNATATLTTSGSSSVGSTATTTSTLPSTVSSTLIPAQTTTVGTTVASPIMMTGPGGLLGNATLSASDVSSLKSAVDTFASSYTSGANASADSSAVSTLQTALKSLDSTIFSENHVVASSNLTAFQQAVNTFVTNYTSGKNPAADATAWSAFQTSLGSFGQSLQTPTPGMTSSTNPGGNGPTLMSVPMPIGGGGMMGTPGLALTGLLNAIVSGSTLTSAQVSTLKSGIDTFASAYTSGANATTDAAAVSALETSIDGLLTATPMPSGAGAGAPVFAMVNQLSLTKAQVTTIHTAVDTFATNYTSGANPTADSAALTALETSLQSLALTPPPTSTSTSTTNTTPAMPPPQQGGGGFLGFLANTTLTTTQVSTLKSAVDTFASTYTAGANASTDSAAIQTLTTSIASVFPAPMMAAPMMTAPMMTAPMQGMTMIVNPGTPPGAPSGTS